MDVIVRLYTALTTISRWIEDLRIACLVRVYGIDKNEKPPIPWRVREGLPRHDQWPEVNGRNGWPGHLMWVTGKVKVGPVRPVPAKLESNLDTTIKEVK